MNYIAIYNDNYLEHHGVKGMKWGVRRYQNADGTLTDAGKKRYGSEESYAERKARNKSIAKKVAIGVGAAVAIAGMAYVYSKHSDKINEFIASKSKSGFDIAKKAGKQFVDKEAKKIKKSASEALDKGMDAAVSAAVVGGVGAISKKVSDKINNNKAENGQTYTQNVLSKGVDTAFNTFSSSMQVSTSSSGGKTVGKDLAKKLGPAPQRQFTPSDETRYQAVFKNDKVKNNVEARQTVKTLRRQGYDIDQIEQYIGWL